MATYNGGKYLQEQLDSFVAQTRRPDELVITDDGSTDDTLEVIKRFAQDAPFKVVWSQNKENLGYAGNFNAALMKTTGDLVFLSDQDDVWFPDKIERLEGLAETDQRTFVFMNDATLTDANLVDTGLTKLGQIYAVGFEDRHFVMGCCSAIRREFLDLCLPIPFDFPTHDDWIVGIAGGLGRKRIIRDVLQYYRRHGSNESQLTSNRTVPVNRWSVRISDLMTYITARRNPSSLTEIKKQPDLIKKKLLLEWAHKTAKLSPAGLVSDLCDYCEILDREYLGLERRHMIQSLGLPYRVIAATRFWREGGYKQFSGFDSALRDILFS